jgi:hypothetical protein
LSRRVNAGALSPMQRGFPSIAIGFPCMVTVLFRYDILSP